MAYPDEARKSPCGTSQILPRKGRFLIDEPALGLDGFRPQVGARLIKCKFSPVQAQAEVAKEKAKLPFSQPPSAGCVNDTPGASLCIFTQKKGPPWIQGIPLWGVRELVLTPGYTAGS